MSLIIPIDVLRWIATERMVPFMKARGHSIVSVLNQGIDTPLTDLGSTLLHFASMQVGYLPDDMRQVIMRFLIEDCSANVNVPDIYGRTPLTMFIADGIYAWCPHPWYPNGSVSYGIEVLDLMFAHGANANVLYTPDYIALSGCKKWRLVHECEYGRIKPYLPTEIKAVLAAQWDKALPDSNGRIVGQEQGFMADLFA